MPERYLIPRHWAIHLAAYHIGISYDEVLMAMGAGVLNPYNTASVQRTAMALHTNRYDLRLQRLAVAAGLVR